MSIELFNEGLRYQQSGDLARPNIAIGKRW